jgi:hypothetical protein
VGFIPDNYFFDLTQHHPLEQILRRAGRLTGVAVDQHCVGSEAKLASPLARRQQVKADQVVQAKAPFFIEGRFSIVHEGV